MCGRGRFNAVCNSARSVDKARDRKLRLAVYVQATQVTRYAGREEGRERAVFHLDTNPAVGGDGRPRKYRFGGGKDSYAVGAVATDSTATEKHAAPARFDANTVVVKAGIE